MREKHRPAETGNHLHVVIPIFQSPSPEYPPPWTPPSLRPGGPVSHSSSRLSFYLTRLRMIRTTRRSSPPTISSSPSSPSPSSSAYTSPPVISTASPSPPPSPTPSPPHTPHTPHHNPVSCEYVHFNRLIVIYCFMIEFRILLKYLYFILSKLPRIYQKVRCCLNCSLANNCVDPVTNRPSLHTKCRPSKLLIL